MSEEELMFQRDECRKENIGLSKTAGLLESRNKDLNIEVEKYKEYYDKEFQRFRSLDINSKGDGVVEDILQDMKKDGIKIGKIKAILEKHLIKPNP